MSSNEPFAAARVADLELNPAGSRYSGLSLIQPFSKTGPS